MYKVDEIIDKNVWEQFIDTHCYTTFMQSWNFGIFEINTGHNVKRVSITHNNKLLAVCQIIEIHAKKGSFLYIPHGPIITTELLPSESYENENFIFSENQKSEIKNIFQTLYDFCKNEAHHKKCSFIRFNTSLPNNPDVVKCITYKNIVKSPIYLTSENGCVVDISSKNTDLLLQNMRKTTRYSIKKSVKDGVKIIQKPKDVFLTDFFKLYKETSAREQFAGFSNDYITQEFEAFDQDNSQVSLVAEIDGKAVAAGLFIKTNNALFYHQGASNHPKIPAPYLLQWEAIKIAIDLGCKYYNFWGTLIPGRTPKSWAGLSLFKLGFGTRIWSYIPTYDLVIDWKRYIFMYFIEHFIRFRRGV